MVVVLTHTEMSYLVVGLFDDLVAPFLYFYLFLCCPKIKMMEVIIDGQLLCFKMIVTGVV